MTKDETKSGIHIEVSTKYLPEQSIEDQQYFFFTYAVKIINQSPNEVQLISRKWQITNAEGQIQEVEGLGVVGQQPKIASGSYFEYSSYCPLNTAYGAMEGSYEFLINNQNYEVPIPIFILKKDDMLLH